MIDRFAFGAHGSRHGAELLECPHRVRVRAHVGGEGFHPAAL